MQVRCKGERLPAKGPNPKCSLCSLLAHEALLNVLCQGSAQLGSTRSASSFNWIFPPLVPSRLLLPSNSENKTFVCQTLSLLSFLTSFGSLVVFSANVSPTQTESRRTSSQGRSRSQMRSERASLGRKKKSPKRVRRESLTNWEGKRTRSSREAVPRK